jgi:hypothetical protein
MDYLAKDPDAFPVNYANLPESSPARRFQVVVQKVFHFFWPEGMQVDRVFDGVLNCFVFFHG